MWLFSPLLRLHAACSPTCIWLLVQQEAVRDKWQAGGRMHRVAGRRQEAPCSKQQVAPRGGGGSVQAIIASWVPNE